MLNSIRIVVQLPVQFPCAVARDPLPACAKQTRVHAREQNARAYAYLRVCPPLPYLHALSRIMDSLPRVRADAYARLGLRWGAGPMR